MRRRLTLTLMVVVALSAATVVAAGCGSDNKPAYCSDVSDLKQSVNDLKDVQLNTGAVSTLQTDVQKVQSDTNAVVSSAKQDFPNQTSALQSSVSSLSTAIKQLPSSPSAQQLASLVPKISSTVTAAKNLEDATSSACD
jgi:outer membrane murein-binding lipoprotein Lpp